MGISRDISISTGQVTAQVGITIGGLSDKHRLQLLRITLHNRDTIHKCYKEGFNLTSDGLALWYM